MTSQVYKEHDHSVRVYTSVGVKGLTKNAQNPSSSQMLLVRNYDRSIGQNYVEESFEKKLCFSLRCQQYGRVKST